MSDFFPIKPIYPSPGEGVPRASGKEAEIQKRDIAVKDPDTIPLHRRKEEKNKRPRKEQRAQKGPDTSQKPSGENDDGIVDIVV